MRIAVVTGNPKPASRTQNLALAVAGVLSRRDHPGHRASRSAAPGHQLADASGRPC